MANLEDAQMGSQNDFSHFLPIEIEKAENGYIAKVGCKKFVFHQMSCLFDAIKLYFENPKEARERYCKGEKT